MRGLLFADGGIARIVRSVGLEMQLGRKLLSLQSPQEITHNGCGNHWAA